MFQKEVFFFGCFVLVVFCPPKNNKRRRFEISCGNDTPHHNNEGRKFHKLFITSISQLIDTIPTTFLTNNISKCHSIPTVVKTGPQSLVLSPIEPDMLLMSYELIESFLICFNSVCTVQRTAKARNAGKSSAQITAQAKASGKATSEKKCKQYTISN